MLTVLRVSPDWVVKVLNCGLTTCSLIQYQTFVAVSRHLLTEHLYINK